MAKALPSCLFHQFHRGELGSDFFPRRVSAWDGKFHVEFAQTMERACFDYIMLEDTLMLSEAYRLRNGPRAIEILISRWRNYFGL